MPGSPAPHEGPTSSTPTPVDGTPPRPTDRRTTDLLAVPFAFSQTGVLSAHAFIEAARARHLSLTSEHLEVLWETGVLAPFFVLVNDPDPELIVEETAGRCESPFDAHVAERMVIDPAVAPGGVVLDDCRFSSWQLLTLSRLGWSDLQRTPPRTIAAMVADGGWRADQLLGVGRAGRKLAVELELVSTRYMPGVHAVVRLGRGVREWRRSDTVEPAAMLSWLGLRPDDLRATAEVLLATAHSDDPLASWAPLTGHAAPSARKRLRGAARVAVDHREAAELLLRLYEDLPLADPKPTAVPERLVAYWQPLHERLRRPAEERERILTELGLSPHPSLIIAVEGETEELLVPRALERFGLRVGSGGVEMAPLRGVGNDIGVLARYAGAPRLGEEIDGGVLVRRPLAHLAVVVDPEHKYANNGGEKVRRQLIADLERSVPGRYRTATLRADLERLVSVNTWGGNGGPFEFANCSDHELASAVHGLTSDTVALDTLIDLVAAERARPNPNIDKVLHHRSITVAGRLTKLVLAEQLWRMFEPKIDAAAQGDPTDLPLAQICAVLVHHWRDVRAANVLRY